MFPIVWLPCLVVNDNPTATDFCVNKGASRILGSDIQLSNYVFDQSNISFGGYGLDFNYEPSNPEQSTKMSLCLGEDYIQIWSGFTMSVHVRVNPDEDSDLIVIQNSANIMKMAKSDNMLTVYLSSSGVDTTETCDVSDWSSFVHLSILTDLTTTQVYVNGEKVIDIEFGFMDTVNQTHIIIGYDSEQNIGFSSNITICNLRVYDRKISKRKLFEDMSFLFAHYLFDGENGEIDDETNCVLEEYDASGTGFDVEYLNISGNGITVTADSSPSRELSCYATAEDICFPIKLYGNYCIIFWARNVSNGDVSLIRLVRDLYPEQNDISGRRFVSTGNDGQQSSTFVLSDSEWHLCMADVKTTMNGDTSIDMYLDLLLVSTIPNDDIIKTAGTNLDNIGLAVSNCSISDIKVYGKKPTKSELDVLYNRNVLIDKNGTVCATKLEDISYNNAIGFGSRGQIKARSFSDNGNSHIMKYDYITGHLDISDFEEK